MVQFVHQLDQRTRKAREMKVQHVLVCPEWLRLAEWMRDHLDCHHYRQAYKGLRTRGGGGDTLILDGGYSLANLPRFFEGAEKLG